MTSLKFCTVLILHTFLFLGFMLMIHVLPVRGFDGKDMFFSLAFSALYFLLVWFDLYSRPYHHYLKFAFGFIFRDLLICSAFLFGLEYVWSTITSVGSIARAAQNDLVLVLFYFAMHVIQYVWIVHLANLGFFRKNVMLVGSYDERIPVEDLFQNVNNTKNFVGQILLRDGAWLFRGDLDSEPERVAKPLSNFLFSRQVNELIICMDEATTPDAIRQCASWCLENSIGYYLIPDISRLPRAWPWQNRFQSIPAIERFCPNRDSLIMISLKRLLDIAVSSVALVCLLPVFLAVAVAVKLEDGGPVLYVSDRVGIHGKKIRFFKFRSMVVNADALKDGLLGLNERPDGPLFKLTDDPRVTRVGAFLRRTSIDELPQLLNVLRGDMSLIGPRPQLPNEVAEYSDIDNLRLECIPGISCLPQIYGRDTLGFREWVDLDLAYRKNWSLWYDLRILFKTVKVVLRPASSN